MKFFAVILAIVASVNALNTELSLKERIAASLEASVEVEGVQNCANKCSNVFNKMAYLLSTSGSPTFEYQACMIGCNNCTSDIATNAPANTCINDCKNFPWLANGYLKGVIEPDKACIFGCIIQTCQGICTGGTVDATMTKANQKYWWGYGGCSIKTQPYSQQSAYVPWNSPNTAQGGDASVAKCCSNALSLCLYSGDKTSQNYAQLFSNTQGFCAKFVPSKTYTDICTFYNSPQNCGYL